MEDKHALRPCSREESGAVPREDCAELMLFRAATWGVTGAFSTEKMQSRPFLETLNAGSIGVHVVGLKAGWRNLVVWNHWGTRG